MKCSLLPVKKLQRLILFHEDARHFQLKEPFDGVISTSASLNHMPTLQDLEQVFAQVYASLRPGGLFLFDLNHPQQMQKWWQGTPTEGDILEHCAWMVTPRYDIAKKARRFPGNSVSSSGIIRGNFARTVAASILQFAGGPVSLGLG